MKKTICWGLNRFFMEGYRTDLNCGFFEIRVFFLTNDHEGPSKPMVEVDGEVN